MKLFSDSHADIERDAIDETHLTNNNVHSLAWQTVRVDLKNRASDVVPASILSNIDGYTKAGTRNRIRPHADVLTFIRATDGADGPVRQRQNHVVECTGP